MSRHALRLRLLTALLLSLAAAATAQTKPAPPAAPPAPTHADILRGAYGPYRANNDLLYYHLDIRVDPDDQDPSAARTPSASACSKTARASSSTSPDTLDIDKILSAQRALKYERDTGAVFVDFPRTLHAGQVYSIDFYYSGHPPDDRPLRRHHLQDRSRRPRLDQHRLRRRSAPASGGPTRTSGATKSRAWTSASPFPTTSSTSPTASSSARPISATATRAGTGTSRYPINNYDVSLNIGDYVHFARPARRPARSISTCCPKTSTKPRCSSRRPKACSRPTSTTSANIPSRATATS